MLTDVTVNPVTSFVQSPGRVVVTLRLDLRRGPLLRSS